MNKKDHWEKVFTGKQFDEVSWYQPTPAESLEFIQQLSIPPGAAIIDIGAGDSFLVDHLLQLGYTNITILDISSAAIEKAKHRLGSRAGQVNWIVSDVLDLKSDRQYDCWHDRASFHFLTTDDEIGQYLAVARQHIKPEGKMIIGTFSTAGPEKCSGLPVKKYNESGLTKTLQQWFQKIKCITADHITPFNALQQFIFCSFKKLSM